MLERLGLAGGRAEAAVAMISYGASSVYWLALAFALSPADYGRMMTLQAAVLIVVTIFTLRTHDLFFNLIVQGKVPVGTAYATTLRVELVAAGAGAILCSAGAFFLYPPGTDAATAVGLAVYALLASFGVIHGASIGKLRYWTRGDIIAKTDLLSAAAWAAACLSIPFVGDFPLVLPLIIGALPNAARTLALIGSARALALKSALAEDSRSLDGTPEVSMWRFLAEAQVVNFLKNAAVPIETMLLAAFTSPSIVAMYRVARATQGAVTAALNVLYQRAYPTLARATSKAQLEAALGGLKRKSLILCVLIFPLSALIALGYSLLKPEIGVVQLQLITAGTFLALLPSAYQQGAFAVLSLAGHHRAAGRAYIFSFLFLGLSSLLLIVWPSVEIFVAAIIGAAFVRCAYLVARSRQAATDVLAAGSGPSPQPVLAEAVSK